MARTLFWVTMFFIVSTLLALDPTLLPFLDTPLHKLTIKVRAVE